MKKCSIYTLLLILLISGFSSCEKSQTNDGIVGSDRLINQAPVGYKFPAKFEGWSTLTSIEVYEKGKKIVTPTNAKEKYFPITINLDPIPNYNIPEDYQETEYIYDHEKIGYFGYPFEYKFNKGIFKVLFMKVPYQDTLFYPVYGDLYGGDFYHLKNYRYYLNVDGNRILLFSCTPLTYNQILSNYSDKMYTSFDKENIRNVAIATISLNLNLVTNQ